MGISSTVIGFGGCFLARNGQLLWHVAAYLLDFPADSAAAGGLPIIVCF